MRNGLAWFETYVPRRLVGQLMANPSPDVVASRQIEVTVLFTDIVGFSRLAEQLDAAQAANLLNQHFELLAGCVGETDGTVDKFLGDGMMAFWGAPVPQPDHAARAVRAALLIRDRLRTIDGFPPLRLRIGLHTGPALVGNIGARDRLNYTLVGDTVNVTQRLEQLGKEIAPADPMVILASAATAAHAQGLCTVEPLGPWRAARPRRDRRGVPPALSRASAAVTVSPLVRGYQDTIGAGRDELWSIDNLTGSAFDDSLTGDDLANLLDGGAEADTAGRQRRQRHGQLFARGRGGHRRPHQPDRWRC